MTDKPMMTTEELGALAKEAHHYGCGFPEEVACSCGLEARRCAALRQGAELANFYPDIMAIIAVGQELSERLGIGLGRSILAAVPRIMREHAEMVERIESERTKLIARRDVFGLTDYGQGALVVLSMLLWPDGPPATDAEEKA